VTIFSPLTWMVVSTKASFFLGDLNVQLRPIALMQALKSFQLFALVVGSLSCNQTANPSSMNLL
jgi:uncharacterized membrane-anchored protein